MKLYYRPKTSGRPMRAAWLLEELGADYETVAIEERRGTASKQIRRPTDFARQPPPHGSLVVC